METSSTNLETPTVFRKNPRGRNLELVAERTVPEPAPDLARREAVVAAKELELQAVMATIRVALSVFSQRCLTVLALVAGAGLFAWSVIEPTGLRLSSAIAFAVCVLLPLAYLDWATRRS